jgi:hypothetical protein
LIGLWIVNLVIPGEPQTLSVKTPTGVWTLNRASFYGQSITGVHAGQCANTYAIEHPVSMNNGSAECDLALDEMTPLLLGASYLTRLSVTAKISLPHSEVAIVRPSSHWPRERAMGDPNFVVATENEFLAVLEAFISAWSGPAQGEKALLLIHHWLDSLACWSFEDLYLSATTLLQIVAATEDAFQGRELSYFTAITDASCRAGIAALSRDFKDMRNNLIHEGKLLGGKFSGKDLTDCAVVVANVLNWFDEYIHSVLGLGIVRRKRFSSAEFVNLNAYSI